MPDFPTYTLKVIRFSGGEPTPTEWELDKCRRLTVTELMYILDGMARHKYFHFPDHIEIIRNGRRDLATGLVRWDVITKP